MQQQKRARKFKYARIYASFFSQISSLVLLMARREHKAKKNQKVKKVVMRTLKSVINFTNYYFSLLLFFLCAIFSLFCIIPTFSLAKKIANANWKKRWKLCPKQQQEQDPTNLYLANLPLTFKETDVEQLLAKYGQVISTRILRDQQGTSKGNRTCVSTPHGN